MQRCEVCSWSDEFRTPFSIRFDHISLEKFKLFHTESQLCRTTTSSSVEFGAFNRLSYQFFITYNLHKLYLLCQLGRGLSSMNRCSKSNANLYPLSLVHCAVWIFVIVWLNHSIVYSNSWKSTLTFELNFFCTLIRSLGSIRLGWYRNIYNPHVSLHHKH